MSEEDGLICAYRYGSGITGKELGWDQIKARDDTVGTWVHLGLDGDRTHDWLKNQSGLPTIATESLLYEETRPRCTPIGDGLIINLRGVNLNPGANPEDMVSIRLYIDQDRIVSVRRTHLMAVEDIRDRFKSGAGPETPAEFLQEIVTRLLDRMGPVIADLDDAIDDLEDRVLSNTRAALRGELWHLRRQAIALRRYIAPQREAIARLATEDFGWVDPQTCQRLREVADRITRFVEDLDAGRERAAIIQDELTTRLSEQMNRNMYMLSVIAAIFLPMTVITGLLGINVAGIPGDKWAWSFTVVSVGMVVLGFVEYAVLKRLKWI